MNLRDECPHCGKPVIFVNNSCPVCLADRTVSPTEFERLQHQAALVALKKYVKPRPLSTTLNRLMLGAAILGGTTFASSVLAEQRVWFGLLGCLVGLVVASSLVFAKARSIEKTRWQRFWPGYLIGYWVPFLSLVFLAPGQFDVARWPVNFIASTSTALVFGMITVVSFERSNRVPSN